MTRSCAYRIARLWRASIRLLTASCVLILLCLPARAQQTFEQWREQDQAAFQQYKAEVTRQYEEFLEQEREAFDAFVREAGVKWGGANVWIPEKKTWVQYTEDLAERSSVRFEEGEAEVQILIGADRDPAAEEVRQKLCDGVARLVLSGTVDPIQMFRQRLEQARRRAEGKRGVACRLYTVQAGDTLWGVSKRFKVDRHKLAELNGIDPDGWLQIGQVLRIPVRQPPAQAVPRGTVPPATAGRPWLEGQVRMSDGTAVDRSNAGDFAAELVAAAPPQDEPVRGDDGTSRRAVRVRFRLVPDHLRIRAERFRPLVMQYATRYDVDPPLVFAVIHTESAFNPRARSSVPAYGLMQLVPGSGARDAYRFVHGQDKLVTGEYLYDPQNNIRLGTAFVHVLGTRYLSAVSHPQSRVYCVIAAYNTGAGNVARAFGPGTSVSRAAPVINRLSPEQVYVRLRTNLPYEETREYVQRVRDRMPLYEDWR